MKKVIIEMENGDIMKGELYPDVAPITCLLYTSIIRIQENKVQEPYKGHYTYSYGHEINP